MNANLKIERFASTTPKNPRLSGRDECTHLGMWGPKAYAIRGWSERRLLQKAREDGLPKVP